MALGVRMKTSDNKRPKFSGGRSGGNRRAEPFARRKQQGSRDNSEGQNSRRWQANVGNAKAKRSFLEVEDSDTDGERNGRTRVLRGPSGKRVAGLDSKRMGSRKPVEPSAGKFKPRGRSVAWEASKENLSRFRGKDKRKEERNAADVKAGDDDGAPEKSGEEKKDEKTDPAASQRRVRIQSRVLNRTGKKVRLNRKALGERQASGDAGSPPKKKKRVIKIDPHDTSNKRLDDSVADHNEKVIEERAEISKNAQFRSIQPSPAILSFVEDNLLGRRRLIELQNAGYNVKLSAPLDNVAFSTSTDRERIEENVFRNKLEFFAAAKISSSFPPPLLPEIAFAGRSNVGKSSLLNALTRQWGVVRTSDKPGLTQTINFFRLASKLCLVDLPGYGFAYAKDEVKESWEELVKEYVSTRVGLQRVCLLIDTKWGMKPRDHELVELMERSQTPYQIVLTKTDLVFPIDVARRAMQIQEDLKSNKSAVNPVMMISSKSGGGIRNLRTVLAKLARFVKP